MKASTLPIVRRFADVESYLDTSVEVHGTYSVLATGRHKIVYTRPDGSQGTTNKVVRLELDGGAIDLWARPEDEMTAMAGKRVVATGKLIGPMVAAPAVAAPDARPSLVEIASVTSE